MLTGPTRPPRLPLSGWALVGVLGLLGGLLLLAGAWRQPAASASLSPLTSLDPPAAAATVTVSEADEDGETGEPVLTEGTPPAAPAFTLTAVPTTRPTVATIPTAAPTATGSSSGTQPTAAAATAIVAITPPATPEPAPQQAALSPPTGPPRIGLQVGHWRVDELPEELLRLRGASGGSGGGRQEWEVNLEVAEAVAERLRARGYVVDVLPATIPPGYVADVFLSIHADASTSPGPRGFKIARSGWSRLPATDDALVQALTEEYRRATGLPWDDAITRNMTRYYAFNNRRRQYAIDKSTPGALIEMGYLTNAADRAFLFNQTERVVEGIASGLVRFLEERPPVAEREQPATVGAVLVVNSGGATVHSSPSSDAPVMARIEGGRRQDAPEVRGDWYGIWVVERNGPGWVHRSEATVTQVALP